MLRKYLIQLGNRAHQITRSLIYRSIIYPDPYRVLEDAVESGVDWGWMHAHKHTDTPSEEQIKDSIRMDVMNEISERFRFGVDE